MVGIVIFFSSILAILFFLLGTFFKAMVAAVYALLQSSGWMLLGIAISGIGIFVLFLLGCTLSEDGGSNLFYRLLYFFMLLGILALAVFFGAIFFALFGGEIFFGIIFMIGAWTLNFILGVLNFMVDRCENGYEKFLKIIVESVHKC